MTGSRDSSLLRLQQGLMTRAADQAAVEQGDLLPFESAGSRWAVACEEVERVVMPTDITSLAGYPQLPHCVVGIVASDGEMLSVIDAGLLLGSEHSHSSLKSRLIIFRDGPMKGFAMLVDRVHARVCSGDSSTALRSVDAAGLHARIQHKPLTRREAQ